MRLVTLSNAFLVVTILTLKYSQSAVVLDVSVTKGGDVLLSCLFGNNDNITWTENNQKIGSRQLDIDKQFRLHVKRIRNSTMFKCKQNTTLSNLSSPNSRNLSSFQISRSFNIKIIDTNPVMITEGQNASLPCPGQLTNVSWSNREMFSSSLNLTNVQRDDNDTVRCNGLVNGNKSQANVQQIIKLDIQYPPENITIRLIPNSNILNGTLEIVCSADGNPAPRSFRWFMDGTFIKNTTGSLKIFSLKYTDGGLYSCAPEQRNFTQNNLTRKSIFVVIKGPPSGPLDVSSVPAVRSKNSLGISWKPPKYNGNETIYLYQVVIKYTVTDGELIFKKNTTSLNYTARGLQSETKYSFMVRALNKLFGPGPWSEQIVSDFTKPDNSKPTMLTVIRVNYTNVMRATWKKPLEINPGVKYLYELCYEEVGVNNATLECYNTSELTWQTEPLKEYKEYCFKVRSCIKEEKRCSPFTAKHKKETGPKPPEKPFGLCAKSLSPTQLNITWKTKIPYDAYHVKHGIMQSNLQKVILTRKFYVLSKLKPNTSYIVQVYAETITKNDNRKVIGKACEKIFTTVTTTNKKDEVESDELKVPLVALAVFAFIALLVASIFLFLYLRPTHDCYQILRQRRSTSEDAFTMDNVTVVPTVNSNQTPRQRLTSFSSFKKHGAICKNDPIPSSTFPSHVTRLHSDSDYLFSLEFEAIGNKKYFKEKDKKIEMTCNEAKKSANKPKNRYPDISPYDHSLVVLTELENESDSSYINANYIDSYRKERAYIAAQGPLESTVSDFWRMIWESNSRVLVMTTNLFERSKSKCFQYWPDKDSANYGLFQVTILKEEAFANYVVRSFSIQPVPEQTHYILMNDDDKSRIIHQFHYTEWPDHDVPIHPAAILRYIKQSKAANPPGAGPIVVHCSAGVGRSGTYIVIDSMMEMVDDDKTVDIFNFLNHIRTQRNFLVQEEKQYSFVHDALLEYINFGDSNIAMKQFQQHVQSLETVNPDTKKSGFDKEFEDIDYTNVTEKHKWAAKKLCNTIKNRREDVVPVERTRVKLPPVLGSDGADYINASYMDGFSRKKEYIATQAPMHTTVESFWRMVWTIKSNILVMLLDDEECKKDDYFADLPTAEEEVICGKFEIQLESQEDVFDHVTVRKLRLLSTTDSSCGRTITHYHYHHWPSNGFPNDKTSVILLVEEVRNQKITENEEAPITVYCDFGVGRTGVFCLLSTLFDQLEKEQSVDVYQTAKLYRLQRPKLIETEDQYKFCYDILNLLVTTKLGSSPTQTASDAGNEMPDVSDTEAPEKSGTDNPDISGTNAAGFTESQEPLLSHNDEQEADSEGSKAVDEINEGVMGDALL